jgi:hypothetical protein
MVAIALGVVWLGYAGTLYGYCLIRGYDISFMQLVNPARPYAGKWPPPPAGDTNVFPSGTAADQAQPASSGGPGGSAPIPGSAAVKPKTPGKCPPGFLWDGSKCLRELP